MENRVKRELRISATAMPCCVINAINRLCNHTREKVVLVTLAVGVGHVVTHLQFSRVLRLPNGGGDGKVLAQIGSVPNDRR